MGTAMHQLDRVVTGKGLKRLRIAVDADRAHARWLALHQRTAPQVALDVNAVRRHQRNQRLAQTARRLRPEISHVPLPSHESATHRRPDSMESRDDQRRGGGNPAPATTYIILSRSGAGYLGSYSKRVNKRYGIMLRIIVLSAFIAAFFATPGMAQKKGVKDIEDNKISLTSFSVPIVRRGRIKGYEYATITMKLSDLKHGPEICDKRFHLADEFLLVLHDHPIELNKKKEQRVEAEARLRQAADKLLGPGIISAMTVSWSRRTRGSKSIFGVYQDILCKTGGK